VGRREQSEGAHGRARVAPDVAPRTERLHPSGERALEQEAHPCDALLGVATERNQRVEPTGFGREASARGLSGRVAPRIVRKLGRMAAPTPPYPTAAYMASVMGAARWSM
jgi:hypothetical protein